MSSQTSPGDAAAEIEAEIADHLATAAERLESQGLDPTKARQQSQEKFGDVAAIGRRCYWIKQGDTLMFRGAIILLIVVLCLGLGITTVGSWTSQAQMAQQMNALTEQLKALAERPVPASPSEQHPPQEITGKVYVGTPQTPAANKELSIINARDASVVRRIMTDSEGQYRSGPLGVGDYCLVSTFEGPQPAYRVYPYLQSGPIWVYPGYPAPGHDLDIAYHGGRLSVELTRSLDSITSDTADDRYTIQARLLIQFVTEQKQYALWTSRHPLPPVWPLYVMRADPAEQGTFTGTTYLEILKGDAIPTHLESSESSHFTNFQGLLPPGRAKVVAAVIADVIPRGYKRPSIPTVEATTFGDPGFKKGRIHQDSEWRNAESQLGGSWGPVSRQDNSPLTLENDDFFWMTKGLGKLWLERLMQGEQEPAEGPTPYVLNRMWLTFNNTAEYECEAPITSGCVTRLRVEIPRDLESKIKELVESTTDPTEFAKFTLGGNAAPSEEMQRALASAAHPFFRKVKITVVGTQPLNNDQGSTTAGALSQ
jgi:hypothetical protein